MAHTRGRIVEEDHYYAYGLKIAGISSRKLQDVNEGLVKNDFGYNDKELFDDGDLNWLDYGFRNYDAQIGRFPQLDPLTDDYPFLTPYQYGSNDPIGNIDLDGLEGVVATVIDAQKGIFDVALTSTKHTAKVVQSTASAGSGLLNAVRHGSKAGSGLNSLFGGALKGLEAASSAILKSSVNVLANVTSKLIDFKADAAQRYRQLSLNNDIVTANTGKSLVERTLDRTFSFENIGLGGGGLGLVDDVFNLQLRYSTVAAGELKTGVSLTASGVGTADLYRVVGSGIVYTTSPESQTPSSSAPSPKYKAPSEKSINQLNKDVQTGRAPKGIKRFDKGRGTKNLPEDEAHFEDGASLYRSGKWRHDKGHKLTNEQSNYLKQNGWRLPK